MVKICQVSKGWSYGLTLCKSDAILVNIMTQSMSISFIMNRIAISGEDIDIVLFISCLYGHFL